MMPSLLSSQQTADAEPVLPAIILSLNNVDFKLIPTTSKSEVSYRNESDNVILSLTGFTGTLKVSKTMITSLSSLTSSSSSSRSSSLVVNTNTTTTSTVEDDPVSPESLVTKKPKKVSPRQQTLPFKKTASGTSGKSKNSSKQRCNKNDKKSVSVIQKDGTKCAGIRSSETGIETENLLKRRNDVHSDKTTTNTKRSRSAKASVNDANTTATATTTGSFSLPISMGQASQASVDNDDDMNSDVLGAEKSEPLFALPTTNEKKETNTPKLTSVQDILDNDSVATVRDNDDGDVDDDLVGIGETITDHKQKDKEEDLKNIVVVATSHGDDHGIINDFERSAIVRVNDGVVLPNPPARWGHTMTTIEDGKILVYGGASYDTNGDPIILSDVHVYDPIDGRCWHAPINCRGEARQWHSSTYIPGRKQIISFGGEQTNKSGKSVTSDTLRVFDTEISLWYPPAVSGDIPTGRSGHTATLFPESNELIMFGGVKGNKWLNSVSILDVTRWIWTSPQIVGTAPKPRSYHSATKVGAKMVIFGGNNKTSCFDTVHVLEVNDDSINTDKGLNDKKSKKCNAWKWTNPTVTGKAPLPRTGHTTTLLEDGKTILVYGGWDPNEEDELSGEENIFQGSYLLDTQDWSWKEGPNPQHDESILANNGEGNCGGKRCGHAACLNTRNGEVFIFGGRIPGDILAGDIQKLVPHQEKTYSLES